MNNVQPNQLTDTSAPRKGFFWLLYSLLTSLLIAVAVLGMVVKQTFNYAIDNRLLAIPLLILTFIPFIFRAWTARGKPAWTRRIIYTFMGAALACAIILVVLFYSVGGYAPMKTGIITGPIQWEKIAQLYDHIYAQRNSNSRYTYSFLPIADILQCEKDSVTIFQMQEGCCGSPQTGWGYFYDIQFNLIDEKWLDKNGRGFMCQGDLLDEALLKDGKAVSAKYYNIIEQDQRLYVGTNYRTILALEKTTGKKIWETPVSEDQSRDLIADSSSIYQALNDRTVISVDKLDGSVNWEKDFMLPSFIYQKAMVPFDVFEQLSDGNLFVSNTYHRTAVIIDAKTGSVIASPQDIRDYANTGSVLTYWVVQTKPSGKQWPENAPIPIGYTIHTINTQTGAQSDISLKAPNGFENVYIFPDHNDASRLYYYQPMGSDAVFAFDLYRIEKDGQSTKVYSGTSPKYQTFTKTIIAGMLLKNIEDGVEMIDLATGQQVYSVVKQKDGSCTRTGTGSEKVLCLEELKYQGLSVPLQYLGYPAVYLQAPPYFVFWNKKDTKISVYNTEKALWSDDYTDSSERVIKDVEVAGSYLVIILGDTFKPTSIEVRSLETGDSADAISGNPSFRGDQGNRLSSVSLASDGERYYFIDVQDDGSAQLLANALSKNTELWKASIGRPVATLFAM